MRLTLRTLLAYMDDILEPEEHEDLTQKIEASDFATDLIHRIRDSVRRMRLGAPDVLAEDDDVLDDGHGGDANLTAEYLDNTLTPEGVAEFERTCLEPGNQGDIYLAEAACCHQILRLVLVEPVEIDADMKRRLYNLPGGGDSPGTQAVAVDQAHDIAVVAETPVPPAPVPQAETHELPEYLREAHQARRNNRRWLVIAAACLGVVAYFGSGALQVPEEPTDVAEMTDGQPVAELQIGDTDTTTPDAGASEAETGGADSASGGGFDTLGESSGDPDDELGVAAPFVPEQPVEEPAADATDPDTGALSTGETTGPDPVASLPPSAEPPSIGPSEGPVGVEDPPLDEEPLADAGVEEEDTPFAEDGSLVGDDGSAEEQIPATTEPQIEPEPPVEAPTGPVRIGLYFGDSSDLLLLRNPETLEWFRMREQSAVSTGDRLLNLPSYSSLVVLDRMNLSILGGTELAFPLGADRPEGTSPEDAFVDLVHGRVLFSSVDGGTLLLRIAGDLREVELGESSRLAVEVRRLFVPGADYEGADTPVQANWYMVQGEALLTGRVAGIEDPVTREVIVADKWVTLDGVDGQNQASAKPPSWVVGEKVSASQRRARSMLAANVLPGAPVGIRLLELSDPKGQGRRIENRALIAEASLYVGEYEPFVKELNDTLASNVWESHIETLRQALALSPETAARVREALVTQRGEQDAQMLMELIRGYGPEQVGTTPAAVKEGVLSDLISLLDAEYLDLRVLAYHNLNQITGTKKLEGYEPTKKKEEQERVKRRLWARLDRGDLLPKGF